MFVTVLTSKLTPVRTMGQGTGTGDANLTVEWVAKDRLNAESLKTDRVTMLSKVGRPTFESAGAGCRRPSEDPPVRNERGAKMRETSGRILTPCIFNVQAWGSDGN